jgi:hypothetical protein
VSDAIPTDAPYALARKILLDALEGIGRHRDAMVLVGAQAVYLRVGEADLAVAPYTSDGDLAVDVSLLEDTPALEAALAEAGFHRDPPHEVGIWRPRRLPGGGAKLPSVDLLVPIATSPTPTGRTAQLRGHDRRVARNVAGLEGALVDHDVMTIAAVDPSDRRTVALRVAGPAALLVAKVHKIHDRIPTPRLNDKDALDVLRLLRGTTTADLADRYRRLQATVPAAAVADHALDLLRAQFVDRRGIGVEMARRAVGDLADVDEIGASCVALAGDLVAALAA